MKVYGPYLRKDGRQHIILYENKKRKTVSYPKYLMEQHIGRSLNENETIDHINGDFTDNRIENLQILDRKNHSKLDALRADRIKIVCISCGKESYKRAGDLAGNAKKGRAGPFCSYSCSGKYTSGIQYNKIERLPAQPIPTELQRTYTCLKNKLIK